MRFTYRAAGPITVAVILTVLGGCSRTQQDWRAAQQAGTAQAYDVFARRHPDSELAGVAHQRSAQLTEEAVWQQAARTNTAAAYQGYLTKYPNGTWSGDARIRMESKALAAAPQGTAATTPDAGGTVPPTANTTASVSFPSSSTVAQSNFAVQLGAFSSDANAREAWRQLASRFGPQLAALNAAIVPVTVSGRPLYRLDAGVASRSAARQLCRQLQQHGQGCLPLP